jgi:hypothetical protein
MNEGMRAAAISLARVGDPRGFQRVLEWRDADSQFDRDSAVEVLEELGGRRARFALIQYRLRLRRQALLGSLSNLRWRIVRPWRVSDPTAIQKQAQSRLARKDEDLANQLVQLLESTTRDGDQSYERIRSVGEQINANGGLRRMQLIGYRVAALGGEGRKLEHVWDRIGEWQE